MADTAWGDLQAAIQTWDQAAWSLAALALAAHGDGPPELATAADRVKARAGPGVPAPAIVVAGRGAGRPGGRRTKTADVPGCALGRRGGERVVMLTPACTPEA